MAADDDRGSTPDPWDEIVAEGLGEESGDVAFRFEEAAAEQPAPADATASDTGEPAAERSPVDSADGEAAADSLVEDWLSEGDAVAGGEVPPLSVFAPEDAAAGSSAIDIGTGTSGIGLHGEPRQEEIGAAFADGSQAEEPAALTWAGAESETIASTADGEPGAGFPVVEMASAGAVVATAATAAKKPVKRPAKPAKKSGGLGQLVGIVLGGLMAIPITLAILIYGLGKDPFGVAKAVPPQAAFLLPQKFRPGYKKPAPAATDVAGGSALDALPAAPEPAAEPEPAEPAAPADEEPAPVEPPAIVDAPGDMPAATDVASIDPPGLDDLAAPPPVAPVEPPPLDTAALDEAVGEAVALCTALGAVEDKDNRAYKLLRTRWYRALARVAEELVAVENDAATSGRPLAAAPDNVTALHGHLVDADALAAELAALAPDWLAYAKRGSDGVVVPVIFESARRVGPYWTARASITAADGRPRDLTIVSRTEPAAIAGDRVIVTGVALDEAVIWAADVRGGGSNSGL